MASPIEKRANDVCAEGGGGGPDYDQGIHIAALFVVLVTSFGCTAFPPLAVKFPKLRIPWWILFIVRHFGTGVILSTAFVHLLTTAFKNLLNPCMGEWWNKTYPNMVGAIVLAAIFIIALIEMGSHRYMAGSKKKLNQELDEARHQDSDVESGGSGVTAGRGEAVDKEGATWDLAQKQSPESPTTRRSDSHLQVFLLEAGIIFHSIFIGIGLGVSGGENFVPYWIAIIFHRTSVWVIHLAIPYATHANAQGRIFRGPRPWCTNRGRRNR